MTQDTDILIVGGGLNGCTLALAFAASGLRVTLLDSLPVATRSDAAFDGRSYAIAQGSKRLLDALHLWPALAQNAQPILSITASHGRAGEGPSPFFLRFDHAEIEEGPMGYMIEDRHLRHALLAAVAETPGITHLPGSTVTAQRISAQHAEVTLAGGETLAARLLVGCDGRGSATAMRAGIGRVGWNYAQTALVCAVEHEKPHNGAAHQFFMPAGPLAILPLTGNRSSVVWTEQHAQAAAINGLNDADYLAVLRPRFGDFLGDIVLTGARYTYPLALSLAKSMVGPRMALAGDAAHGVHPIAGQGLNLGLRDVAALAEVVTLAHRRGEDFGGASVLERYAAWRRFDTAALATATDAFNRLFSNDNPIVRAARGMGLGAVNSLPGLRRLFIREAAGLTGDLPRLMTGRQI